MNKHFLSDKSVIFTNIRNIEINTLTVDFCISCSGIKNNIGPIIYFAFIKPVETSISQIINEKKIESFLLKDFTGLFVLQTITPKMIKEEEKEVIHENAVRNILKLIMKHFKIRNGMTFFIPLFLKKRIKEFTLKFSKRKDELSFISKRLSSLSLCEVIKVYESFYSVKISKYQSENIKYIHFNKQKEFPFSGIFRK